MTYIGGVNKPKCYSSDRQVFYAVLPFFSWFGELVVNKNLKKIHFLGD